MSRLFGTLTGAGAMLGLGLLVVGCVEQAEEKPSAEDQEFVKKNLLSAAPTPQFAVNADLDGKVTYLGADVSPTPAEAGKDLKVTHYWKVNAAPGEGWRTFTHVQGPNRAGYLNVDHGPVRGKYPVSQWKAGNIVKDEHVFRVPATWQYERLELYTGLWKRNSGPNDRMPIKAGPRDDQGRILAFAVPVKGAQPAAVAMKRYLVHKTTKPIKLDGKLDEAAWKSAPTTGAFVNTLTGGAGEVKTEAKMLWDDQNLYVAFENADSNVWSSMSKRDDHLWGENAVEVMIDADGDGKSYVELQVGPNGNIFDTYLQARRQWEDSMTPKRERYSWNSKAKAGVSVDGTLNKQGDKDKGWTVELAIPLADANGLNTPGVRLPPQYADAWRVNLYRMSKPDPKGKDQLAAGWSPPMEGDFHVPARFGQIVFTDENGNVPAPAKKQGPEVARAAAQALKDGMPVTSPNPDTSLKLEGHKAPAAAKGKKAAGDSKKK